MSNHCPRNASAGVCVIQERRLLKYNDHTITAVFIRLINMQIKRALIQE